MTQKLLTRPEEIKLQVTDCVTSQSYCRVYLKMLQPMYGKFAILPDFAELASKGMYRFVSSGREVMFNNARMLNQKQALTKILKISEIEQITKYQ